MNDPIVVDPSVSSIRIVLFSLAVHTELRALPWLAKGELPSQL